MTFLNPWFLLGTLLVVVPVVIHLWFQRKLKKIPFSTLQFLKRTEARRFGWLKLREWLILFLRCLFILLLFLSLARPQLKNHSLGSGRLASVLLIIDNSYSMSYGGNFQTMMDIVRRVIAMYSPNSEFCIIPLCRAEQEPLYWMTKQSAVAHLDKIGLANSGGKIRDALSYAPVPEFKYAIEYIYIGDGQSANFEGFADLKITPGRFYWVRVPAGNNIAISKVALKDPLTVPMDEYVLEVTLTSYSARIWSGRVGLTRGDFYVERPCDLMPGVDGAVDFTLPLAVLSGQVQLFDDSLLVDNAYYFSKSLPQSINVLVVGSSPYVMRAMVSGHSTGVPFKVDNVAQVSGVDLRRYDVLLMEDIREISEMDEIKILDHLARPGAALIVILHEEVGSVMQDFLSEICRIKEVVTPKGYVAVDWIAAQHPVLSIFSSSGALKDVQYYRYQRVHTEREVLARFAGGDPFIIVKGNVAVITGALNAQSTNFVYKSSFVPVILRLMLSLTAQRQSKELFVGDRALGYGSVRMPSGEILGSEAEFSMPGFHLADGETLCVNVRPEEGNLNTLGPERARVLNVQPIDAEQLRAGSDLAGLLLMFALVVLAAELILLRLN